MVILFHFFNELKQDWNLSKDSMFGLARKEKNEREGFFFSFGTYAHAVFILGSTV